MSDNVTDLNEHVHQKTADHVRAVFHDIMQDIDRIDGVFVHVLYKDGGLNTWEGGNPGSYNDVIVSVLCGVLLRILPANITGGPVMIPDMPKEETPTTEETEDDQDH